MYSHGLRSASTFGRLPKTRTFSLPFFSPKKGSRVQGEAPQTDHLEQKNNHKSRDFDTTLRVMVRQAHHIAQSLTFQKTSKSRTGGSPSTMLRDHEKPTHHTQDWQ
jgi:hypothetical protein